MSSELRFQVIVSYPHKAGQVRPTTHTSSFASRLLADSFKEKVEREPGVKAVILDKDPTADAKPFNYKPFACLSGMRVG
jgi:hypothetical protein